MTDRVTRAARLFAACILAGIGFGGAAGFEPIYPPGASAPKVAKLFKGDLVQAFTPCTAPDTSALGDPACTGPAPTSAWKLGPGGRGTLQLKARRTGSDAGSACAQGTTGVVYKVKLLDVRGPDGTPFTTSGPGDPTLALALTVRVSHVYGCPDCLDRDCTVPDQSMSTVRLDCQQGTCRASGQDALLGAGTNIALSFAIRDPDGNVLAVPGHRIKGGPALPSFPATINAKTVQTHLVGAAAECTAPNVTAGAMAACRPVERPSSYRFGSDGRGLVVLKRKGEQVFLRVVLKDVRDATTHAPVSATFTLAYVDRRTSEVGCDAPPCTRADVAVEHPIVCQGGRCRTTIVAGDPGFAGASVEIDAITVLDPNGAPFAVPGLKTR